MAYLKCAIAFLPLLALALPQGHDYSIPGKFCLCVRPESGLQDPESTAQICPSFEKFGAYYEEADAYKLGSGDPGQYVGACSQIGFNFKVDFANLCIALYGVNDGIAGAQCCSANYLHTGYTCEDWPPDQPS